MNEVRPTPMEVAAFAKAKSYTFDPNSFWDWHEQNGWYFGGHIADWKSACAIWNRYHGRKPKARKGGAI